MTTLKRRLKNSRQTRQKILVTDDSPAVLELFKSIIESWGYEVVILKSKVEALERLREIKPDLVITDLMSPDLSGFDFIRLVKEFDASIPVIVISGNVGPKYDVNGKKARKALRLGASDCIPKPFNVTKLRKVIDRTLKTRRSNASVGIMMKPQRDSKPSKDKREYWLFAERKTGSYPKHTDRGGKWLIFVPRDAVDEVWHKIKRAVEEGKLGSTAKVSTAKPNPNSTDSSKHVVCVYTYDALDEADVRQIRVSLRQLGITSKIPYKTDDSTLRGRYRKSGDKRISLYYE